MKQRIKRMKYYLKNEARYISDTDGCQNIPFIVNT